MTAMTIRATNATFESASSGDYPTLDDAYRAAVLSALNIATEEIANGAASAIVDISVDLADQPQAARGAVAISHSRILAG